MSEPLTDAQIAILNAARTILDDQADGYPSSYGQVRALMQAEEAERAISRFLNTANTWCGVPMTRAQLHNDADLVDPEDVPEGARP